MEESNEEVLAGLGMALGGVVDAAAEAEEEEEREEDHLDADEEGGQAVLDVAGRDGVVGAEAVGDADEVEDEVLDEDDEDDELEGEELEERLVHGHVGLLRLVEF